MDHILWSTFRKEEARRNGTRQPKPQTDSKDKEQERIVSVLPALAKAFAADFAFSAFCQLMAVLLQFVSPQILKYSSIYVE